MDESTRAGRLFAIRAALGEGPRKPMSLRAFADLLTERAEGGRKYHASQLSGWETGASEPGLDDVALIASLDPEQRGPGWLAFGTGTGPAQEYLPAAVGHPSQALSASITEEEALRMATTKRAARKRGGANGY